MIKFYTIMRYTEFHIIIEFHIADLPPLIVPVVTSESMERWSRCQCKVIMSPFLQNENVIPSTPIGKTNTPKRLAILVLSHRSYAFCNEMSPEVVLSVIRMSPSPMVPCSLRFSISPSTVILNSELILPEVVLASISAEMFSRRSKVTSPLTEVRIISGGDSAIPINSTQIDPLVVRTDCAAPLESEIFTRPLTL